MKSLETKLKELGSDEQFRNKLRATPVQEFGDRNAITEIGLKLNGIDGATQLNGGYFEKHEDGSIVPTDVWIKNNGENDLLSDIISPWIIGEYKWVKVGTIMPAGWEREKEINIGDTLICSYGENKGRSDGNVKSHTHTPKRQQLWIKRHQTGTVQGDTLTIGSWNDTTIGGSVKNNSVKIELNSTGGERNLAAGMYAELWIYTGKGV